MAAASAVTSSSISTSLWRIRRSSSFRFPKVLLSASPSCGSSPERPPAAVRSNYTGLRLDETVELGFGRTRVDSWISSRIPGISRARVQSSIRSGLVTVNGRIIDKVSHILKGGDKVSCVVCELEQLKAEPEEIPLNIVYEDEHVLVVNKPAHMEEYTRLRESQAAAGEGSSAGSTEYSDYRTWSQAVGGMQHGRVYGLGSQAYAYEGQTSGGSNFSVGTHETTYSQHIAALTSELEQVRTAQTD